MLKTKQTAPQISKNRMDPLCRCLEYAGFFLNCKTNENLGNYITETLGIKKPGFFVLKTFFFHSSVCQICSGYRKC